MKKQNILKNNSDFNRIIQLTEPIKNRFFLIFFERSSEDYKFGISVSKKIGNAVVRNRLKRQVRSLIDKYDYKKNFNCIIMVRKAVLTATYSEMLSEYGKIINILKIQKEK